MPDAMVNVLRIIILCDRLLIDHERSVLCDEAIPLPVQKITSQRKLLRNYVSLRDPAFFAGSKQSRSMLKDCFAKNARNDKIESFFNVGRVPHPGITRNDKESTEIEVYLQSYGLALRASSSDGSSCISTGICSTGIHRTPPAEKAPAVNRGVPGCFRDSTGH